MRYKVTVHLRSGDSFTITCRYMEVIVMWAEALYGEEIAAWDACAA